MKLVKIVLSVAVIAMTSAASATTKTSCPMQDKQKIVRVNAAKYAGLYPGSVRTGSNGDTSGIN